MFFVELACSDPRCDDEMSFLVEDLAELDLIGCQCGHGLVTVRIEGAEPLVALV